MKKVLLLFGLLFFVNAIHVTAQSVSATYTDGNISTGYQNYDDCTPETLELTIPIGATVTGVDVEYDMRARNNGRMSHQRSQIYCQETASDEGGYSSGSGNSGGTYSYNRSGLSLANGVSTTGILTFEMRAYRTNRNSNPDCTTTYNRVENNSWKITVNYTEPIIQEIDGYLGPGGVGDTDGSSALEVWLRADDLDADNDVSNNPSNGTRVDSWNDYSGNAKNYTNSGNNRPTYKTSGSFNAVNFEASLSTPQFLEVSSSGNYTDGSAFYVSNPVNEGLSTVALENNDLALRIEQHSNRGVIGFTRYGIGDYSSTITTPFGVNSIISWHKTEESSDIEVYSNDNFDSFDIGTSSVGIPYGRIGKDIDANTDEASGDVFEVILYSQRLNTAELIIVNNYLSAKYGSISIDNDYYTADTSGENFDHKVAGIGQASDGSNHTDSQGTGIVRINTPSDLDDNEFLFWGEDEINADYSFLSTNETNYFNRIDTKWRVSKHNDLGDVSVSFNISDLNLNASEGCNELTLIVSADASFNSGVTTYTLVLDQYGVYTATNVSFDDNNYFTLEYKDEIVWDGASTYYNGSGTANAPAETDACLKFLVKDGNTATLTANAHVREVEVETGGVLEIASDVILTITNGIINNGTINVLGEGQVIQTHTGTSLNSGTGSFTITQEGTSNQYDYNYWSASVNNGGTWKLSELEFGGSPVVFTDAVDEANKISTQWLQTFNGTSGNYYSWNQIDPATANIASGEGFSMKGPGGFASGAFTFNGEANDGDYILPATGGNDYLVGNPYPSDLNADEFIADNAGVIDGTLYFWEQFTGVDTHILRDYQGGYATYNDMMGVSAGSGSVNGEPTGKIAIGQAFFVTISNSGDIEFNNSQRDVSDLAAGAAVFYKTTQTKTSTSAKTTADTRTKIWFSMADESDFKRVIGVGYDGKATEAYDSGYDSYLANFYPDNFYWTLNGSQLMVQGLPSLSKTDVIDLGVEVANSGTYTFAIDKSENLPENTPVYLKDKETNTYYNLLEETPVTLQLVAGTNYASRYAITYAKETTELSVDSEVLNPVTVSYKKENQQLIINNYPDLNKIADLKIYSLTGQAVLSLKSVENKTVQLPKISNGLYLLEINNDMNEKMVIKFIIK